jgi:hypothetical protein
VNTVTVFRREELGFVAKNSTIEVMLFFLQGFGGVSGMLYPLPAFA